MISVVRHVKFSVIVSSIDRVKMTLRFDTLRGDSVLIMATHVERGYGSS